MEVRVQPEPFRLIEAPRVFRRVLGVVEFGRVLHDQHDGMWAHAPERGLTVRPQYLLRRNRLIVEEPIGGDGVAPTVACGIDAGLGVGGEGFQEVLAPLVQAFVPQIDPGEFIGYGIRHRGSPCRIGR